MPRRVIVLGAGLAGLAAGLDLVEAGDSVRILEARQRPGGRVETLRVPFADGLHVEAGALFIPDNHRVTLDYVKACALPTASIVARPPVELVEIRGRSFVVSRGARVDWPIALDPTERALGLFGLWQKYVGAALAEVGDPAEPGWPPAHVVDGFDRSTCTEFLRSRGASEGAVELLRLGYLDLLGDGPDSFSALHILRELALRLSERRTYVIRGGNDLLPRALAARLDGYIDYGTVVRRIEPGERSAAVVVDGAAGLRRLHADHVICTLPASVLRTLPVAPAFSSVKSAAIDRLSYTSVVRTYLQVSERVWVARGLPGSAITDGLLAWIRDATPHHAGPRAVLEAYAAGPRARHLASASATGHMAEVLNQVERLYPGTRRSVEATATKSWDDDEWARGAYACFRPGDLGALLPALVAPEGRVHFAGEHCSPWAGWMQGALDSGVRAARAVRAHGGPATER